MGNKIAALRPGTGRPWAGSGGTRICERRHSIGKAADTQPHPAGRTCLRLLHGPSRRARPRDPPRPSLSRVAPPAAPALLFASFGVTRSLSGPLSESSRPSPPPCLTNSSRFFLDRLAPSGMRKDVLFRPKGLQAAVICRRARGAGDVSLGTLFRGGGCRRLWAFHDGGRCCTSKMAAPCRLEEL